jgi:hypothetical protein
MRSSLAFLDSIVIRASISHGGESGNQLQKEEWKVSKRDRTERRKFYVWKVEDRG